MLVVRCLLFYFLYNAAGFWFGITGWMIAWTPYRIRSRYVCSWNFFALFFARVILNIRVNLLGRENIPAGACVVMSKHQSQWETFYLQTIFPYSCTILKQELLDIPFFGWGLKNLEPIAIDRRDPKQALRDIKRIGQIRIQQGRKVLIFPEGTRIPYGQKGNYARSGAGLAIASGVDVLPIAHNAGACWPADGFIKRAGTITVSIGEPIRAEGMTARELTEKVEKWIEAECDRLAKINR